MAFITLFSFRFGQTVFAEAYVYSPHAHAVHHGRWILLVSALKKSMNERAYLIASAGRDYATSPKIF
jgi:hypothetical protein